MAKQQKFDNAHSTQDTALLLLFRRKIESSQDLLQLSHQTQDRVNLINTSSALLLGLDNTPVLQHGYIPPTLPSRDRVENPSFLRIHRQDNGYWTAFGLDMARLAASDKLHQAIHSFVLSYVYMQYNLDFTPLASLFQELGGCVSWKQPRFTCILALNLPIYRGYPELQNTLQSSSFSPTDGSVPL